MKWDKMHDQSNKPSMQDVSDYINNVLYEEFCSFIESTYRTSPKLQYSKCSMQRGWNIKYKKGGKSLCTIYPLECCFIVLIVIGEKERMEADIIIPACCDCIRKLYEEIPDSPLGKWLMIEVKNTEVLSDVKKLIFAKEKPKGPIN